MAQLNLTDGRWQAWSVERSPLGQHRPTMPVPRFVLMPRTILEQAPYIALEERLNGDKFVEVFGIRFQVIGFNTEADLFGLERV